MVCIEKFYSLFFMTIFGPLIFWDRILKCIHVIWICCKPDPRNSQFSIGIWGKIQLFALRSNDIRRISQKNQKTDQLFECCSERSDRGFYKANRLRELLISTDFQIKISRIYVHRNDSSFHNISWNIEYV